MPADQKGAGGHDTGTNLTGSDIQTQNERVNVSTDKARDLGNGFEDHGVAVPVSSTRGVVAVADGDGRDLVLTWLADSTGCYALMAVGAETGHVDMYPMPFPPEGNAPFAMLFSSKKRVYTLFHNRFVEFDLNTRRYTCVRETKSRLGIGMTEDDQGRIWAASYPDSSLCMHDPATGEFRDYGSLYDQPWRQYPYTLAADAGGWIYFSVGKTLSQFIAFDPAAGKAVPLLAEQERVSGDTSHVYRGEDGKVYGLSNEKKWSDGQWYELCRDRAVKIDGQAPDNRKKIIGGSIWPFHREFPSGRRLKTLDLTNRIMVVEDPATRTEKTLRFDYPSEGAHIMEIAALPDGKIGGGSAFPMRFFTFDPATGLNRHEDVLVQTNVLDYQGGHVFIGGYTEGILLDLDPARPWVAPRKDKPDGNPRMLTLCEPDINRPHAILAHPDGHTIVMGGTPGYGHTGGGLLFWDRASETGTLVKHTDLLVNQCVMSLAALPDGNLLVGSGTRAGTGGQVLADEAELFVLDMDSKKILWRAALIPGAQEYSELRTGPGGLIFGLADCRVYEPSLMDEEKLFFVFDPARREITYLAETAPVFGPMHLQQGQRKIVISPDGRVFLLFRKGIAQADPVTLKLSWAARSPVSIVAGGAWQDGRIWFASGSHIFSCRV